MTDSIPVVSDTVTETVHFKATHSPDCLIKCVVSELETKLPAQYTLVLTLLGIQINPNLSRELGDDWTMLISQVNSKKSYK